MKQINIKPILAAILILLLVWLLTGSCASARDVVYIHHGDTIQTFIQETDTLKEVEKADVTVTKLDSGTTKISLNKTREVIGSRVTKEKQITETFDSMLNSNHDELVKLKQLVKDQDKSIKSLTSLLKQKQKEDSKNQLKWQTKDKIQLVGILVILFFGVIILINVSLKR